MLRYLNIANLALIESAEIEFAPGFNVITGESGAGKSVLLSAIRLLFGGRSERDMIRTGCERCVVTGEIIVPAALREEIARRCEESSIPFSLEDGLLCFRRVLTASAVRGFLNDTQVTVRLMREIGDLLVDMHRANEHQNLTESARQLDLLDRFAGDDALRRACADRASALSALRREREEFERSRPSEIESEDLARRLEEIDAVSPRPNEDAEIERRYKLASNSREILEDSSRCVQMLSEGENSVLDQLGEVHRVLSALARMDPARGDELVTRLAQVSDDVNALALDAGRFGENVELDEAAFHELEERMSALFTLKRRYGPTLDRVLEQRTEMAERLEIFRSGAERMRGFDQREKNLRGELAEAAHALSAARREAGAKFTRAVSAKLAAIGFARSTLYCAFSEVEPGANGMDALELMFSANTGEAPREMRKIASSGELSRLMLAMKTVLADADALPVSVFDEIDVNIGGESANAVGRELAALGKFRQVLSVSHLAQVAALGDAHFEVSKSTEGNRTHSTVARLDRAGRVRELGRMLGGGAAALEHASDMLEKARAQ